MHEFAYPFAIGVLLGAGAALIGASLYCKAKR